MLTFPERLKLLALCRVCRFVYIQAADSIAISEVSRKISGPDDLAAVECHAIGVSRANIVQYGHGTPPKGGVSRPHNAGTEHLTATGFKNPTGESPCHRFPLSHNILCLSKMHSPWGYEPLAYQARLSIVH